MTSSEVIGGGRKLSEVVGSRRGRHRKASEEITSRSIKEGQTSNYYITVGSDLICVVGSVKSDMWERKSVSCAGRKRV